jgi:hypothetical protein
MKPPEPQHGNGSSTGFDNAIVRRQERHGYERLHEHERDGHERDGHERHGHDRMQGNDDGHGFGQQSAGYVNAHEPIKSLKWPAMTMGFSVKDKSLFDKLKVGKKVDVEIAKQGSD